MSTPGTPEPIARTRAEAYLLAYATFFRVEEDLVHPRPERVTHDFGWIGTPEERASFFARLRDGGLIAPTPEAPGLWYLTEAGRTAAFDELDMAFDQLRGTRLRPALESWRAMVDPSGDEAHDVITFLARNAAERRAMIRLGRALCIEEPILIGDPPSTADDIDTGYRVPEDEYELVYRAMFEWNEQGLVEYFDFSTDTARNGVWAVTPEASTWLEWLSRTLVEMDEARARDEQMGNTPLPWPTGPARPELARDALIVAAPREATDPRTREALATMMEAGAAIPGPVATDDPGTEAMACQLAALMAEGGGDRALPVPLAHIALRLRDALQRYAGGDAATPPEHVAQIAFDLWMAGQLPIGFWQIETAGWVIRRSCARRGIDIGRWTSRPARLLGNIIAPDVG